MAIEVTIPRLGWSMEEGVFVRWLVQEGEWVHRGDQLFLLESEKATQEIESLDEGILRITAASPQPGETVLVGQVIAYLAAKGETLIEDSPSKAAPPATKPAPAQSGPTIGDAEKPTAGPAARRLARQLNVALEQVAGSGRRGRITADDIQAEAVKRTTDVAATKSNGISGMTAAGTGRLTASPRARRIARELGVDVVKLAGTGRGGRVRERDVRVAAESSGHNTAASISSPAPGTPVAADKIRRTIARRMVASHQATAPVTLTTKVDATNLVNLRRQFQAAAEGADAIVPSITDLMVRLLALAITDHPRLNARWEEERIIELAEVRVGVAVDAEAGLLVPVLGDVRGMGIRQIAARSRELVGKARAGTLSSSDLQGGTITITNLGAYGIDAFTPIINPPEAAILGVGTIRREPVFVDGDRVVAREQMTLSLTFDHRVVDGAPAARFLATLRERIENAAAWLTS